MLNKLQTDSPRSPPPAGFVEAAWCPQLTSSETAAPKVRPAEETKPNYAEHLQVSGTQMLSHATRRRRILRKDDVASAARTLATAGTLNVNVVLVGHLHSATYDESFGHKAELPRW